MAYCRAGEESAPENGSETVPPPADGQLTGGDCKCTVCPKTFSCLQDCLKHELLEHNWKTNKQPRKTLRNKLNSILKSLGEDDMQTLRSQLNGALEQCDEGQELATIFKFHRMNADHLEMIYTRIHTCLQKELQLVGAVTIHSFGSVASGLALRDSDIDIYIEQQGPQMLPPKKMFNRVNSALHRSHCFEQVIAIRQARVPIIKCKHIPTGFSLDINLSCPSSVHNTNFLRDVLRCDTRVHDLMLFLKIWAKQLQLIGRSNMSSFCLSTLVLFYLQQQPSGQRWPPLLPPVQELQIGLPVQLVAGVNYAYQLSPPQFEPLTTEVSVPELIEGFFTYWRQFDFEHLIVAPYLGEAVPLEEFKLGTFKYLAYEIQLRLLTMLQGAAAEPLHTERCMCVQDPFSLNHNIAKSISPPNLEYFRRCVQHAYRICLESRNRGYSDARFYESVLYGVVDEMARAAELENCVGQSSNNNQHNALNYRFTPCRAEMRALATYKQCDDNEELHLQWLQNYKEAVIEIITEIYCLDIQPATPTHSDKHKRLEQEHAQSSQTWLLSGSVDLWTGRLHQRTRPEQTFMECQRIQTEAFKKQRRQNASYAVQLSGLLTFKALCDNTAIELVVTPTGSTNNGLTKKDPLRKFFTMFKCSMQNFNLKEKLQTEAVVTKRFKIENDANG